MPFWPKPVSVFGLFGMTVFISSSHRLPIPSSLASIRVTLAECKLALRFASCLSAEYVVPIASDQIVANLACIGRLLLTEQQASYQLGATLVEAIT